MFNKELLKEAKEYEKKLLNFFWRQGVNINGAEDLVQETYLRLWKYSDRYKKTAKLSTFLFILARQVLIDSYRRESSRVNREEAYSEEINQVESPKVPCVVDDVRWAVSQLSPPLREVVELGFFQELPYKEVAEILSIPIGTVKSRMSNALKRLKEVFNDRGL
ncbi:MAG: RNA polymerase sigma factor [Kiritimatiellae bacterium]|nr:RNA polymerase sigma factor [Kiritimatiellia bacterium]